MHIAAGIGQGTVPAEVNNCKVTRLSEVGQLLDHYRISACQQGDFHDLRVKPETVGMCAVSLLTSSMA